ncbi:MAG: V-type ATPase subunit [Deltaproteobacteria bacterium]|nr:V-type ATPase subunit [Deltaproteobacteria bacterium]
MMDLGYFNARIRGMRGVLFSAPEYEIFLKTARIDELIERLKATPYGRNIEIAGARFQGLEDILASAMRDNLSDTFAALWKNAPSASAGLLKAALSIWEAASLKAVIRGVDKGIKREEILRTTLPAGEFGIGALSVLAGSKDVSELQGYLETWGSLYARPVRDGMEPYLKYQGLLDIELNIDRFIASSLLTGVSGRPLNGRIIMETLALRADAANIMTLYKTANSGISQEGVSDIFLEGGVNLKKAAFLGLAVLKERDEITGGLLKEIKERDLKDVLASADYEDTGMMEELFDDVIKRRLLRLSVIEPLSIALALSFIYMKVREIKNMRLLAASKAFGIPDEELRRHLIYR